MAMDHNDWVAREQKYLAWIATLRAENEQLRRDRDAIRNETLEEAAKVAEPLDNGHSSEYKRGRRAAATIIRSLKEPSDV